MDRLSTLLYLALAGAYMALVLGQRLRREPWGRIVRMALAWALILGAGFWLANQLGLSL